MAAAYALALQALLGSFVLAQAAAAGPALPFVLCVDNGGVAPAPHIPAQAPICNHCAICFGFQAADLAVPQNWFTAPTVLTVSIWSGSRSADPRIGRKSPKLSQGPPRIV